MVRDFKSFGGGNVPIIGGEPTIFEWRPIVSAQCSCGQGKPLLLMGCGNPSKCDGCGRLFAIAYVHYDGSKGAAAQIGLAEVKAAPQNGTAPPSA